MRCLYCGKELALLKRWTSGGEFCSDAHRQQYQEEYTQLALNRLLQATPQPKPQAEAKPPVKPVEAKAPAPEPKRALAPEPVKSVAKVVEHAPEPPPAPIEEPEAEADPAPAEAGFFLEMPVPVLSAGGVKEATEADFERHHSPLLPDSCGEPEAWGTGLIAAGQVPVTISLHAMEHAIQVGEHKLELRDSVHVAPTLEVDLRAADVAGIAEKSEDPMDILIFPQPPPAEPDLWQQGPQSFSFLAEAGALGRVLFGTTGIEDNETGEAPSSTSGAAEVAPGEVASTKVVSAEVVSAEVVFTEVAPAESAPAAPKAVPVRVVNQPARPASSAILKPASSATPFFRPAVRPVAQTAAVETKKETVPELATKPMPVTLHGLPAGRGKPVQVFSNGVSNGVDMQLPRSAALPLRPVMVLEEAPASPAASPERSAPAKRWSDSRSANGKAPEREKPEVAAKAAAATAVKEPEPVAAVESVVEPAKEVAAPKPYNPPPDLDLPSLRLDTGDGFWGKLPLAGKAGVGVGAVLALAGIIFAVSHGSASKPAPAAPQIVEGPALTAPDSGWITDWGAEPGVRREHTISVLKPSMTLSDYRLEFQAQIDNKALGWVYRAQDEKNYYVNKLEIVKPGLNPQIALVRFAVINGQEQPRAQSPLNLAVHLDTLYKVRFDAVGDRFSTYVQDQKVDEWTDDRLKMGGIGLYNERGEHMSLAGTVNVVPLVIRK